MNLHVIHQPSPNQARSPFRVVERATGREIEWINRYLDREHVRRLALTSLRIYAFNLLHFLRWWASVHHSDEIAQADQVFYTAIEEMHLPLPWNKGRVVLIGDAAHSSSPFMGQGGAMALEDGLVLAEMLAGADDVPSACSAFSDRRFGFPTVVPHDLAIAPNDCGGPLVDIDGRCLGVNIARALRVASYALPPGVVSGLPNMTPTFSRN